MLADLLERLRNEPVVVAGVIAGALVLLGGQFDILLDKATVTEAIVPIIAALAARTQVTPTRKIPAPVRAATE